MWKWFNCYLSGRHNFGVSCEPGAIFLRCSHCGRRTSGWAVDRKTHPSATRPPDQAATIAASNAAASAKRRALPFSGVAAS